MVSVIFFKYFVVVFDEIFLYFICIIFLDIFISPSSHPLHLPPSLPPPPPPPPPPLSPLVISISSFICSAKNNIFIKK